MARKLTPTQRYHLRQFVAEYLKDLQRQLQRWGTASQNYGVSCSMPRGTRDALIDAGCLEIASVAESAATIRKGYNFGRAYRFKTIPVAHVSLTPTKRGVEWWLND